jgi:hypothetical protein
MLKELLDAFADDESVDVINAGTLRTTRGTALFLIALLTIVFVVDGLTEYAFLNDDERKFQFVVAAGFMWAIVSSADALARSIATGRKDAATVAAAALTEQAKLALGSPIALPGTLSCTVTDGRDEPGWRAVASRRPTESDEPEFLLVKDSETKWVSVKHVQFD